jgi:transposase
MQGFLTPDQRSELFHELKVERHAKYSDRIKTILLLDKGWTHEKISEALFLDEGTIRNYRKRYVEGGILGLVTDTYSGKRCHLSDKEKDLLSNYLQSKICMDSKEIVAYIQKNFDVTYSISGVTALLHSMGFTYKKTKPVPGKAKREAQELFIVAYNRLKSKGGKIYFADSTHPHHNAVISYGWIKKGEDFEILCNSGRHRLNINGAVDIANLDVITRTCEWVNADSICELLKAIKSKNPNDKKITLIMDNAAYNRSRKVKILAKKLGISLFYLPPYSPNLNPIERLWKFMKKKVLYSKYYEHLSDFEKTCMNFFRGIRKYRDELETLLTDNFQVLGT